MASAERELPFFTYPANRHDAHGDAVYCAPLGKYLMTVYEQRGHDYTVPGYPVSDARKGISHVQLGRWHQLDRQTARLHSARRAATVVTPTSRASKAPRKIT